MLLTPEQARELRLAAAKKIGHLVVVKSPALDRESEVPLSSEPLTVGRDGENDVPLPGDTFASADACAVRAARRRGMARRRRLDQRDLRERGEAETAETPRAGRHCQNRRKRFQVRTMTLRQFVTKTDPGRRRRNNEDVFVCEPPLFAIADGMGGAQAGEVASGLAAEALKEGEDGEGTSEERVNALIQSANRRVYEKAQQDMALAGMGTTLTLALVDEGTVTLRPRRRLARVPPPRRQARADHRRPLSRRRAHARRKAVRGGGRDAPAALRDHQGARNRPGRGRRRLPDRDRRKATSSSSAPTGSATWSATERSRKRSQKHRANLKKAAQELVKAANKGGGEDNITVLLFEVGAAADRTEEAVPVDQDDDEDTLSELDGVPVIAAKPDEWFAGRRRPRAGRRPSPAAQEPGQALLDHRPRHPPRDHRPRPVRPLAVALRRRREGRPRRRLPGPALRHRRDPPLPPRLREPSACRAADPARTATFVRP